MSNSPPTAPDGVHIQMTTAVVVADDQGADQGAALAAERERNAALAARVAALEASQAAGVKAQAAAAPVATAVPVSAGVQVVGGGGRMTTFSAGAGSLGLRYLMANEQAGAGRSAFPVVAAVTPGQVQRAGVVRAGDRFVAINNVSCAGMGKDAFVKMLTARPCVIQFEAGPGAAAAAPVAVVAGAVPPPGAPPGGRWGQEPYCGPVSLCIFCFLFWPIVCCPVDSRTVYFAPDGRRYGMAGEILQ